MLDSVNTRAEYFSELRHTRAMNEPSTSERAFIPNYFNIKLIYPITQKKSHGPYYVQVVCVSRAIGL